MASKLKRLRVIVGLMLVASLGYCASVTTWQNRANDCWGANSIQNFVDKLFNMSGDATITSAGVITVTKSTGAFTVGTLATLTPASLTVTNGQALAATTSYMKITPSEVATNTIANATAAGQILIIENVGTNNLVFNDNGTALALGGNITLGATDTLGLVANAAAQWRRLWTGNN